MKYLPLRAGSLFAFFAFFVLVSTFTRSAMALPSYARQTGLACSGCHYTPPELNPAGRLFKLLGYIQKVDNSTVPAPAPDKRRPALEMLQTLPLGAWFETSMTSTKKAVPGTQNNNIEFPQDISLFLAGAWADHLGSFLQVTFDTQNSSFGMDNTDIRYANKTKVNDKELDYGLLLNNNPTVEDLWMTLPNWGYPFVAPDSAPGPAASAIVQGHLAQDVAGFGGYAMWDNHVYADVTLYRSDHIGSARPNAGTGANYNISELAPYWRVAYQESGRTNVFEAGLYGMHVASFPGAVSGSTDDYTDIGPDFEYDRTIGRDVLSVRGAYVHESANLNASASASTPAAAFVKHHLNSANANVEYHFGNRVSGTVGWFVTSGTADSTLYAPAAISGSANGSPRSEGISANFSYWPVQNVDIAFQFNGYNQFNGGSTNYDGSGRNASDNNTSYLLIRYVF